MAGWNQHMSATHMPSSWFSDLMLMFWFPVCKEKSERKTIVINNLCTHQRRKRSHFVWCWVQQHFERNKGHRRAAGFAWNQLPMGIDSGPTPHAVQLMCHGYRQHTHSHTHAHTQEVKYTALTFRPPIASSADAQRIEVTWVHRFGLMAGCNKAGFADGGGVVQ